VGVNLVTGPQYGQVQFEIDGLPTYLNGTRVTYDEYNGNNALPTHYVPLGYTNGSAAAQFGAGETHTITIDVTGKNANSSGYDVGVDMFSIVPVSYPSYPDLTTAMNNRGITDGTTAANFEPSAQQAGIALATLNPDLNQGMTTNINGIAFNMPNYSVNNSGTDIADNVVSDGQKIALPTATFANNIYLLVASTCGQTLASTSSQLGVNFESNPIDQTDSTTEVPSVPNWIDQSPSLTNPGSGATIAPASTPNSLDPLPYRYLGTSQDATPVHLYLITVPTNWNDPTNPDSRVTSVTLPTYRGSDFTNAGCATSAKLHVFAIAAA
jgi:hypothetical protein